MKLFVLLVCWCGLFWRTEAQSQSYLITAPLSLRLDAVETVLVQLFGFTEEVRVYVFLKTSMALDHVVLVQEVVTLNTQNNHQATAKVRLYPGQLDKSVDHVILHIQSTQMNQHLSVPVSRTNGFLFIQTDKPLYTPHQTVKVRAFSLNQELRPANRSVFLTFKDPDRKTVDIVEMIDVNNGIPSMQNPFKIPIKPKLGIWSIEASYSGDFTTTARADFEVKEYVLPSFSIVVKPETNYISYGSFNSFNFLVTAKYLHGAPVSIGEVFLRYGYVSGKNPPVIIPSSVTRAILSSSGELEVNVNMEEVLSKHNGPRDLNGLVGKYLYIAVMVLEDTGGITEEAEFAGVKFVKSPYSLSLVSTPPFIKPALPYNVQVLVRDHLEKPVKRVRVQLVERTLIRQGQENEEMSCPVSANSQSDGIALFMCNTPRGAARAVLRFETADPALPPASQASLTLEAVAYHSPNQRYLYIDPPLSSHGLMVGQYANIKVYSDTPSYLPIRAISYLVISRGKVVEFDSVKMASNVDNKLTLRFRVTGAMVPSIRLLVYYILFGEGTNELVADSIWLDVKDKCVNGLQTDLSSRRTNLKPKEKLRLDIRTNQDGLVALSAVDTAVFSLMPGYRDPVSKVLHHIERSDLGCGGGGGKDSADVFRLAGLTFITNANAQPSASDAACVAAVRAKRHVTEEARKEKVNSYHPRVVRCCEEGMKYIPTGVTCQTYADQRFKSSKHPRCKQVFIECCIFIQQVVPGQTVILGRHGMGADFDLAPSLVRSFFPESWLWEVQPVSPPQTSVTRTLPDSLTTWEVKAVGMFRDGMCVSEPVQVSVNLPLSVNVPLPYQVVRGEQLDLTGSVYNQQNDKIQFCVTLTAGPAICLYRAADVRGGAGLRSTTCNYTPLSARGVATVSFTLLALEPGEHTLTFTLKTRYGPTDILEKKLRVVPEGVRTEVYSGGRLDPQGLYGSEKMTVTLKNKMPANIVPNTDVERMLTINSEVLSEVVSVVMNPEGLKQLINLPPGSVEAELGGLLPLIHVYRYLETTGKWNILGQDIQTSSAHLKQKIREGLAGISTFRLGDSSYSMWRDREPSTWLTCLVVRTLSSCHQVVPVDVQSLSESLSWLIRHAQSPNGSFSDTSSFRPNKVLAAGGAAAERTVYLTAFALIAMFKATRINEPILQLRSHDDSMESAAAYISQHAPAVRSVYVRAVATYALTLFDPDGVAASELLTGLEKVALQKGQPASLRFWQESNVAADWLKPDQSSGLTVETTAYVLLTLLHKGRFHYANPVVSWLTQDQHYGQGFYSVQDTVLTLEAVTEYSKKVQRSDLNQDIVIRYNRKGLLGEVHLSQTRPVATPIQVTKHDDITASTGYGRGVSNLKLKTVYYETTASSDKCHFDLTIELVGPDASRSPSIRGPYLVACAKYKPRPNEVYTESSLTVMKIQLPTGVVAYLEDLRQFQDLDEPIISHYELQGSTVVIQIDSVPSDIFVCVSFRVRTAFKVTGSSESLFTVYEPQDKGNVCIKQFSSEEQKLQRLCVGDQCQCMTAACATYRGSVDLSLTSSRRSEETCRPQVRYAFKVEVKAAAAEGDFMTYTATVVEVLKNTDKELQAVSSGTEVELVTRATCSSVELQTDRQYLVTGASGSEVIVSQSVRYRLPLDSDAILDLWPTSCSSQDCEELVSQLEDLALDLQLQGCPGSL